MTKSYLEFNNVQKLGLDIVRERYEAFVRPSMFYIPTRYPDVY